jgi:hypothetical protein
VDVSRSARGAGAAKTLSTHYPEDRRETQGRREERPGHGRRGTREIDYVFLVDLWAIIKHQWKHVKGLFPNQAWVETLITGDMNVARRPLAHMNPLSVDDVTNVEVAFRKWVKQLRAVESLIP